MKLLIAYNKNITVIIKNTNNLDLDIGYMYNQDDVPTYFESSNSDFNRGVESFSGKLYIKYKGISNMTISNHFNSQISNYNRFSQEEFIEYLSETNWNRLLINYDFEGANCFGITHLELQSNYKYTISDLSSHETDTPFLSNNYQEKHTSFLQLIHHYIKK